MIVLFLIIFFAVIVLEIAAWWIVFTKAGKPGWSCLVPVYSLILLCDITHRSRWWTLLYFIPFVSIVAYIVVSFGLARSFGRGDGFGVGLILLPFIFVPILAFGDSQYSLRQGTMVAGRALSASGMIRPQQGATLAGDTLKQQPRRAKCPHCASTTFRVEEEAGYRRCSNCHSVLPSYIQGSE